MSGKWGKYGKKYRKEWETEKGLKEWIRSVPNDDRKAFCKYCNCEVRAHHGDLVAHAATEKHKKKMRLLSQMPEHYLTQAVPF